MSDNPEVKPLDLQERAAQACDGAAALLKSHAKALLDLGDAIRSGESTRIVVAIPPVVSIFSDFKSIYNSTRDAVLAYMNEKRKR